MAQSEPELLDAARAGDNSALANLMRHYQDAVYRFGRAMCGSEEDAKDVLQDTLLTLMQRVSEFRGEASHRTWLYAVARSQCSRRRRKVKREVLETEADHGVRQLPDPAPLAVEALAAEGEREAVQQAIGKLSDKYREVLVLRDIEGMTAPEVAEVLELSVEAVKSRLHRARAQIRDALSKSEHARPNCPDVVELFSRHMEGELTGDDCARMQQHLEKCSPCQGACASLERLLGTCRQAGREPAPPEVRVAVSRMIERLSEGPTPR